MAADSVKHYLFLVEEWLKMKEVEEKASKTIFRVKVSAMERPGQEIFKHIPFEG